MPNERKPCFLCGRYAYTERHHIFGAANRKLSEQDGLVVDLCHPCHNEPPYGVHFNKETMERLHRYGQKMWEDRQVDNGMSRDEARKAFIRKYGKNYIYL